MHEGFIHLQCKLKILKPQQFDRLKVYHVSSAILADIKNNNKIFSFHPLRHVCASLSFSLSPYYNQFLQAKLLITIQQQLSNGTVPESLCACFGFIGVHSDFRWLVAKGNTIIL